MNWNPDMASAPRDEAIRARIPGYGDDNIIEWVVGLLDSDGVDCGGWAYVDGPARPNCWHDGICWEVNENGRRSIPPTHWSQITTPGGGDE